MAATLYQWKEPHIVILALKGITPFVYDMKQSGDTQTAAVIEG